MPYSVKEDFEAFIDNKKLIALTKGTTEVNEENLDKAIAKADSLINSYLNKVVTTPLTSPPDYIKDYSVLIAVKIMQRAIQYKDIPAWVSKEYDGAINHLKDIATGKALLGNDEEADPSKTSGNIYYDENANSIFDLDSF